MALCLALGLASPALAWPGTVGAGGGSTIEIVTYEKQPTLTIEVVDKASGVGLSNVRVELRDPGHPETPPITGSPHGTHETDADGRIEIKLFPDADKKYQIQVNHLGYTPYVGEIFTVEADTYRLVKLVKSTPTPPGGGDDDETFWVNYYAGAGGSLEGGDTRELVSYNGSPKKIPTPIPDAGYDFAGWTLDSRFVEPEKLKVQESIHLYAVFELSPVPPVPMPIPPDPAESTDPAPTPPQRDPTQKPIPPAGGGISPGPWGPGGPEPGTGNDPGGNGGSPEGPSGPDRPVIGPGSEAPPAGHTGSAGSIQGWIWLCIFASSLLAFLRLWAIHKRVKALEQSETSEKEVSPK